MFFIKCPNLRPVERQDFAKGRNVPSLGKMRKFEPFLLRIRDVRITRFVNFLKV